MYKVGVRGVLGSLAIGSFCVAFNNLNKQSNCDIKIAKRPGMASSLQTDRERAHRRIVPFFVAGCTFSVALCVATFVF